MSLAACVKGLERESFIDIAINCLLFSLFSWFIFRLKAFDERCISRGFILLLNALSAIWYTHFTCLLLFLFTLCIVCLVAFYFVQFVTDLQLVDWKFSVNGLLRFEFLRIFEILNLTDFSNSKFMLAIKNSNPRNTLTYEIDVIHYNNHANSIYALHWSIQLSLTLCNLLYECWNY